MTRSTSLRTSSPSFAHSRLLNMLLLIVLIACFSGAAFGQATSGTIFGTVKDPSGAVVAGATVTAGAADIGLTRTATSSDSGEFAFPNLPPATYSITVTAKGFKTHVTTGVVVGATDRVSAGAQVLEVGGTETSVSVTAEGAQIQLQSNSGERSDTITSKQLNDVALNGRMVLDYVKLVPGVISSFDGHQSGTGGIDGFNINGTRANQHEFTIDGASNVDTGNNGGTHVTINTDAIQEVKILTSNYQAEYGKAAGGQVVVTTKSGTSQFHGDARFFHRHEGLNANEWFNKRDEALNDLPNQPGKYRYNYAGYQIGGPVLLPFTDFNKNKDRLFFFWGQEYYRQLLPVSGDRVTFYTPTALERVGDFSQSFNGNGNPVQIAGPGVVPGTNKIDRSLLSPAQQAVFDQVSKILSLYPLPNAASGYGFNGGNDYNYLTSFSPANPRREDIFRLDYQINSSNRFFGRYIGNADTTSGPVLPWPGYGTFACTGGIVFSGGCSSKHPGWNLSINLTSTITPTLLNEFSFGPSVTSTYSSGKNGNLSVGVNGINLPLLYPVTADQSIPDLGFGGLDHTNFGWTYLGATPWHQANTTINLNDNVSWVKNNHTFKFGVFYQRNRKDQIAWGNVNGQFSFGVGPSSPTGCDSSLYACGDPLASALMGAFDSFSQSAARPIGFFRYNQLELYAQDTWKLTSRLTLDYGMRFAWVPPQTDARNQIAIFDPAAYDPAKGVAIDPTSGNIIPNDQPGGNPSGDPLNGMVFTNNHQIPAGGWDSRGIMPEPRIGFAYDLSDDHKTVLRGGFGMMHDRTQGNLIFNEVFNNPILDAKPTIQNNNIANLGTVAVGANTSPLGAIYGASRDGKVPTVYSFSLGVQHELSNNTTLDMAYVGTLSRHLTTARDINAIPYGTEFTKAAQDPNATFAWWSGRSGACFPGGVVGPEAGLPTQYSNAGYAYDSACAYSTAYLVPYKGYGQMEYLEFNGNGNYNSLQVSLQRRFAQGLTFGAVYTWSKAMTTANSDEDFLDPFNTSIMYRPASFDRTHVFAANYVYNLPSLTKHFGGPKWLSFITDDFQLSGITQFMTGNPMYPNSYAWNTTENQVTGSNDWGKMPIFLYVNKDGSFQTPQLGAPGKPNWDVYRSGGMQNWDMSIFKNIKFTEARYIQLRLEAFNVFNHPNFYNKDLGYSLNSASGTTPLSYTPSGTFGQYNSTYSGTGGPRVVQLGAKFYF